METLESNRLIAKFMGCDFEIIPLFENSEDRETEFIENWSKPPFWNDRYQQLFGFVSYQRPEYMCYESSWDWLMPVYMECQEEANLKGGDLLRVFNELFQLIVFNNIKWLYEAVVQFILWHNQNK